MVSTLETTITLIGMEHLMMEQTKNETQNTFNFQLKDCWFYSQKPTKFQLITPTSTLTDY